MSSSGSGPLLVESGTGTFGVHEITEIVLHVAAIGTPATRICPCRDEVAGNGGNAVTDLAWSSVAPDPDFFSFASFHTLRAQGSTVISRWTAKWSATVVQALARRGSAPNQARRTVHNLPAKLATDDNDGLRYTSVAPDSSWQPALAVIPQHVVNSSG